MNTAYRLVSFEMQKGFTEKNFEISHDLNISL